jgi:hypothetical protein
LLGGACHRAALCADPLAGNDGLKERSASCLDSMEKSPSSPADSSGIGLAAAKKFVEEGAHVFIMGRRQSELDKAKAAIGSNVTTVQGDVADLDRLYQAVRKAS